MIILKVLGDPIRGEEQARKLPLARIIAAGPPADSGITLAAWRSWYECEFFACPRRGEVGVEGRPAGPPVCPRLEISCSLKPGEQSRVRHSQQRC